MRPLTECNKESPNLTKESSWGLKKRFPNNNKAQELKGGKLNHLIQQRCAIVKLLKHCADMFHEATICIEATELLKVITSPIFVLCSLISYSCLRSCDLLTNQCNDLRAVLDNSSNIASDILIRKDTLT